MSQLKIIMSFNAFGVMRLTAISVVLIMIAAMAVSKPANSTTTRVSAPAKNISESENERARTYFTDTELITHKGENVRLYTDVLEGKVVMINVMYTSCKGACPMMTQKLSKVSEDLGKLYGTDIHFVSLSNDPERDTPEALTKFANTQDVNQQGWTFLTGPKTNIDHVITKLGLFSPQFEQHTSMILLGNTRTGHWMKIQPDTPYQAIVLKLQQLVGEG